MKSVRWTAAMVVLMAMCCASVALSDAAADAPADMQGSAPTTGQSDSGQSKSATQPSGQPAAPAKTHFIDPAAIDFKKLIGPPPAPDSAKARKDLEEVLALQASRTPEEIARAKAEDHLDPFVFSGVLGHWFNPDDLPATTKLLKRVSQDTSVISSAAKRFYGRQRPPLVDARVKPCVAPETSPSYPSGHSTHATVWAIVLAEMFPEQREALVARGRQIGDDRVIGGIHFPSDVAAGRVLGAAIAAEMLKNPDFQKELETAKQECLAAMPKK